MKSFVVLTHVPSSPNHKHSYYVLQTICFLTYWKIYRLTTNTSSYINQRKKQVFILFGFF